MIDYRNAEISKHYSLYPSTAPNKNWKFYLTLCFRLMMRYLRFNNFKNFISSNITFIVPQKISELDCVIIGSDQVWNTKLTNGYDPFYWGDIPFNGNIISYATSMNATALSLDDKILISKKLENFNSISVREQLMVTMLQPLSEKKIIQVLDPTMLNDFNYWKSRCRKNKGNKRYVLAYPLRDGDVVMKKAHDIAQTMSCELKVIKGGADWNPFTIVHNTAGPAEALSLIDGASFILTSSFHGTALSILLRKQFYTIRCRDGNNVRTESILTILGLSDRLLSSEDNINIDAHIDYIKVESLLETERKKSRFFLINSIHE